MLANEIHLSLDLPTCPKCQSATLHRSASRTLFERLLKKMTIKRLHRCSECAWRGWARPSPIGTSLKTAVMCSEPPSMDEIDQALALVRHPVAKAHGSENADLNS
jgi:hypothetical protein